MSCASFRVAAGDEERLHEEALRALLESSAGGSLDEDVQSLPIVRKLLAGKLKGLAVDTRRRLRQRGVGWPRPRGRSLTQVDDPLNYSLPGDGFLISWKQLPPEGGPCVFDFTDRPDFKASSDLTWPQPTDDYTCKVTPKQALEVWVDPKDPSSTKPRYRYMSLLPLPIPATETWYERLSAVKLDGRLQETKYCPDDFVGLCRAVYEYQDQTYVVDTKGYTIFDLQWKCEGIAELRSCDVVEGTAEYRVFMDLTQEAARLVNKMLGWKVSLAPGPDGRITLPPFMACVSGMDGASCSCTSFPKLAWSVAEQAWEEVGAACSTAKAAAAAQEKECAETMSVDLLSGMKLDDPSKFKTLVSSLFDFHAAEDRSEYVSAVEGSHSGGFLLPFYGRAMEVHQWEGFHLWKQKFAPWLPACAPLAVFPPKNRSWIGWTRVYNASFLLSADSVLLPSPAPTAEDVEGDSIEEAKPGRFVEVPYPAPLTCKYNPFANSTAASGSRSLLDPATTASKTTTGEALASGARRELKRGGAVRTRGCGAYKRCATKTGRAPPRRP